MAMADRGGGEGSGAMLKYLFLLAQNIISYDLL